MIDGKNFFKENLFARGTIYDDRVPGDIMPFIKNL
jgi:hypothetical protein